MVPLVLTFVGDDRSGLVNAISDAVAASGATWLESRSAHLAGKFAGVLRIDVPAERLTEVEAALRRLEQGGLWVTIERGAAVPAGKPARLVKLDILGQERPGIVRDVTRALTDLNVNIEEFSSGVESEPFTGNEMFRATARLLIPAGLALEDLRKALERLAGEIMVDLAIGERDATG
jgi:glycine cleavage system regulatory protein